MKVKKIKKHLFCVTQKLDLRAWPLFFSLLIVCRCFTVSNDTFSIKIVRLCYTKLAFFVLKYKTLTYYTKIWKSKFRAKHKLARCHINFVSPLQNGLYFARNLFSQKIVIHGRLLSSHLGPRHTRHFYLHNIAI